MNDSRAHSGTIVIVIVGLMVSACGGATSAESPTSPVTVAATATSTTIPATTTMPPPTPGELRHAFRASLEESDWTVHESDGGWSIWYPSDWETVSDDDGMLILTSNATNPAIFMVTAALDASDTDTGSYDYLVGTTDYAVGDGLLLPYDAESAFMVDLDFDGDSDRTDIYGFELGFATDPLTGKALPEGAIAPTWRYSYYNPDARPATGFLFQIFGQHPAAYEVVDSIVQSFEPPGGIPQLDG